MPSRGERDHVVGLIEGFDQEIGETARHPSLYGWRRQNYVHNSVVGFAAEHPLWQQNCSLSDSLDHPVDYGSGVYPPFPRQFDECTKNMIHWET
jgi:hypothetical protein